MRGNHRLNHSFRMFDKIGVPLKKQGIIYYATLNFPFVSKKMRNICEKAIRDVSKDENDYNMLYEYFTTDKSVTLISIDHYSSAKTIQRLHRKYVKRAYELMLESKGE